MNNTRHIHEVINLIFNAEKEYSVEELYNELKTQFGEDVHFANCADNVFPLQEVASFLLSKNKIRISDNIIIPLVPACSD